MAQPLSANGQAPPIGIPPAPTATAAAAVEHTLHDSSSSPAQQPRRPYTPQFSMATQMLLNRIRTEANGSPSSPTAAPGPAMPMPPAAAAMNLNSPAYQDARRRVVAGMSTTTSMS